MWSKRDSCLILLLTLLVAGCGGNPRTLQGWDNAQPDAHGAIGLPLPAVVLAAKPRSTSTAVLSLDGSEFFAPTAQHVSAKDTSAVFSPAWTDGTSPSSAIACGMYWFNVQDYTGPQTLQLDWSIAPDGGNLWLGFGNWERGRWDWYPGPESGAPMFPGELARYAVSGTGDLLVAVVVLGTAQATLDKLRIGTSLAGGWRMIGHDAQHTRRSEAVSSQTGTLKWQYGTTGPGFDYTNPAVGPTGMVYVGVGGAVCAYTPDGHKWRECLVPHPSTTVHNGKDLLYCTSTNGYLYAVTTAGKVAWRFGSGTQQYTQAAAGPDGECYTGSDDGFIYALNSDGSERWTYATHSTVIMLPVLAQDGTLYCGCNNNVVYALCADGSLKWTYPLEAENLLRSDCTIGPDATLYVNTLKGLLAITPAGALKWCHYLDMETGAPGFGPDGTLFCKQGETTLIALSPDDELLWSREISSSNTCSVPIISNDMIYIVSNNILDVLDLAGTPLWSYTAVRSLTRPAPVISTDGGVVIGAQEYPGVGFLYCFNDTGDIQWRVYAGSGTSSAVFDAKSTAYVFCGSHYLFALNPDGSLQWEYQPPGCDAGTPAVGHDGTVYFGCESGITALLPDRTIHWAYQDDETYYGATVLSNNDTIFIGDDINGYLLSLAPVGSLNWKVYITAGGISGPPALSPDGTAYISGTPGVFFAISADGDYEWNFDLDCENDSSPAIGTDGTIYIGAHTQTSNLHAINPDGTQKWVFHPGAYIDSSPALGSDGTVYVSDRDGYLYAISPQGTLLWTAPAGGYSSPAIGADGVIYVGGLDDRLHALNPDGTQLWQSEAVDGGFGSPAIADDGTLVVACGDGWIRAYGD